MGTMRTRCSRRNRVSGAACRAATVAAVFVLLWGMAGSRAARAAGSWMVTNSNGMLVVTYGSGTNWPQYAVFYLDSSYYRLNAGPGSAWGTSMILQPAYWSQGVLHQGGPITGASWKVSGGNLQLMLDGTIGALQTTSVVTVYPLAAKAITILAQVWVRGSVTLDKRPNEAFKPIQLSSMHDSSTIWDSRFLTTDGGTVAYPSGGWILTQTTRHVSLVGGSSQWQSNLPTMAVTFDQARPVSGWLTTDSNPNNDNVLVWASASTVLPYWGYNVTASVP